MDCPTRRGYRPVHGLRKRVAADLTGIRRRGNRFQVRIFGGIDPATGKQLILTGSAASANKSIDDAASGRSRLADASNRVRRRRLARRAMMIWPRPALWRRACEAGPHQPPRVWRALPGSVPGRIRSGSQAAARRRCRHPRKYLGRAGGARRRRCRRTQARDGAEDRRPRTTTPRRLAIDPKRAADRRRFSLG